MLSLLLLTLLLLAVTISPSQSLLSPLSAPRPSLHATTSLHSTPSKTGAGIGRLELDSAKALAASCLYDMVLVERVQPPIETDSGIYKGAGEQPKLHIGKVLSVGMGREAENGFISPMPDVKPGMIVMCKNPWGIGPKDEETADGRKLSYLRAQDVAGVIRGEVLQ